VTAFDHLFDHGQPVDQFLSHLFRDRLLASPKPADRHFTNPILLNTLHKPIKLLQTAFHSPALQLDPKPLIHIFDLNLRKGILGAAALLGQLLLVLELADPLLVAQEFFLEVGGSLLGGVFSG
jgi:hypothetical protein